MSDLPYGKHAVPEVGAGEVAEIDINGHVFHVTGLRAGGFNSGRRLYRVECLACVCLVHPSTTGPQYMMQDHAKNGERRPIAVVMAQTSMRDD